MRTLLLLVEDEISREYNSLSPEGKQQFTHQACMLLKKISNEARVMKLNQLIYDINNEHDFAGIDEEMLLKLLPLD
jgi:hypothetical protein